MKLMRLGPTGGERPHVQFDDAPVVDVSDLVDDFDPVFFGGDGIESVRRRTRARAASSTPLPSARVGAPVARPGKIVCIGLNYADHAAETGAQIPTEPVVFFKASNTLVGPNDDVRIPRGSAKTDWEVELGVVIGRTCRYLASEDNGVRRQTGSTGRMIFGVGAIVRYLSQFMVLDPGDIINTETPPGVAMGTPGQPYLRGGDVVELGITGLGRQRQQLVAVPLPGPSQMDAFTGGTDRDGAASR
jgi:2-keto-4-pentenoate hydratase/2-oxohepta-3-ene-1,7-dioic acid hydratase in catechol pathway